jgi:putative ABC transport system permease protein
MPGIPRLATALLRLVAGDEDAEVIGGDLEETIAADTARQRGWIAVRAWYWRQTLSIVVSRLLAGSVVPKPRISRRAGMAALRQDLAYAWRSLRAQPGFTLVAVLMLAAGIGANVAIFSLVNVVLFKPLPFADPDRLMILHMLSPDRDAPGGSWIAIWSYPKYQAFRERQHAFESSAIFTAWEWNLTGTESPERLTGELVDAPYFPVLGIAPLVGRTFSADETRSPGSAPIALLGHGLWMRRFGSDPAIVGRSIGLNGIAHTVVGVLPPGFRGLTGQSDLWVPVTTQSAEALGEAWNHSYGLVARRRADVSPEAARSEVTLVGTQVDAQYPSPGGHGAWGATAVPLDDERTDPMVRKSVLLMLAAVGAVLLIVCINIANLTLARALARQRDVAIRLALGASRMRIARQLMTESALLAAMGVAGGIVVAYLTVRAGAALMPDLRMVLPIQRGGLIRVGLGMLGLDPMTMLFTVGLGAGTAILFGLGPAWRASRRDLTATVKASASGSVSHGSRVFGVRSALIIVETALALVLLMAGGLLIKSVSRLQAAELGFTTERLLAFRLSLPGPQYNRARATQLLDQLVMKLGARAEIQSVAFGTCAPLSAGCNQTTVDRLDRPTARGEERPAVGVYWVSPRYFETLGIRSIKGRLFSDHDRTGQPKVVVVNETAARTLWGQADPIGQRISVGQGGFGDGAEVVGVVGDVRYGNVEMSIAPGVYLPLLQSSRSGGLIFVSSHTPAKLLVPILRQEVQALDRDLPILDIKTMDERFEDATWRTRSFAWLLGVFAAFGLMLAAVGVYSVTSQGVHQRVREIGVRMALGATRADILRLIVGRTLTIALTGVVLGIALAVPTMRALTSILYDVTPGDPTVLVSLAAVLLAVAVAAGYLPARRAARVDPLTTLRAE